MFFTDGPDGAGIDTSGAGFLSIFGSNAGDETPSDTSPPDTSFETDSQDTADAADLSAPEPDDGRDLSAEERVAAMFADDLADDGTEAAETGDEPDETDTDDAGPIKFEDLSPEEKQKYFEELREFQKQRATEAEEAQKATVRQAVEAAEQTAVAQVEQAFEQAYEREVIARSVNYYRAELSRRAGDIVRAAKNQDNPDAYIVQNVLAAAFAVIESKETHEREHAEVWGPALVEAKNKARLEARQQSPEAREFVARELAKQHGLPESVIADINHPQRHMTAFAHRAQELADMAALQAAKAKKQKTQRQQAANKELQGKTVRTSSTGRLPAGKPPQLRGDREELVHILAAFRE